MKNKTLVILAGGLGSRFGSLKQVESVGPNGEFIIDYSIYDAIKAGFNKVVFIIKEEHYETFEKSIGSRINNHIHVEYVFQSILDIPKGYKIPEDRNKPWGTSHAILSCKNIINEDFVVINADDFYGRESFLMASDFIESNANKKLFAMVAYNIGNTLTSYGSVKRGVTYEKNGYLYKLVESVIEKKEDIITACPIESNTKFLVEEKDLVSMNFFILNPLVIDYIEKKFPIFFEEHLETINSSEYLLPTSISEGVKEKEFDVKVLNTTSKWYGVTYKDDKEVVVNAIKNMIKDNIYPNRLWD